MASASFRKKEKREKEARYACVRACKHVCSCVCIRLHTCALACVCVVRSQPMLRHDHFNAANHRHTSAPSGRSSPLHHAPCYHHAHLRFDLTIITHFVCRAVHLLLLTRYSAHFDITTHIHSPGASTILAPVRRAVHLLLLMRTIFTRGHS